MSLKTLSFRGIDIGAIRLLQQSKKGEFTLMRRVNYQKFVLSRLPKQRLKGI